MFFFLCAWMMLCAVIVVYLPFSCASVHRPSSVSLRQSCIVTRAIIKLCGHRIFDSCANVGHTLCWNDFSCSPRTNVVYFVFHLPHASSLPQHCALKLVGRNSRQSFGLVAREARHESNVYKWWLVLFGRRVFEHGTLFLLGTRFVYMLMYSVYSK